MNSIMQSPLASFIVARVGEMDEERSELIAKAAEDICDAIKEATYAEVISSSAYVLAQMTNIHPNVFGALCSDSLLLTIQKAMEMADDKECERIADTIMETAESLLGSESDRLAAVWTILCVACDDLTLFAGGSKAIN